jgi:hypothetical protein
MKSFRGNVEMMFVRIFYQKGKGHVTIVCQVNDNIKASRAEQDGFS